MSTPSQFPKASVAHPAAAATAPAMASSKEGNVTSIYRNVAQGVDAAMAVSPTVGLSEAEMRELVAKKVQNLPPLPKTIVDIYALRRSPDPDRDKLLGIIKKDVRLASNLVRISNSAALALSRTIKTPDEALTYLGTRMVINMAMSMSMSAHLEPDLSPYGMSVESFTETTALQGTIINKWREPKFVSFTDDLQFAALLQEIGALVLSKVAIDRKISQSFQKALAESDDRIAVEESVFGLSSSTAAAMVFSEWKFSQDIVDYIGGSDKPESVPESALVGARALKITKILAPLGRPPVSPEATENTRLSPEAVEKARELAIEYGFSEKKFDDMVEAING